MKTLLFKSFIICSSLFSILSFAKTTITEVNVTDYIYEKLVNKDGDPVPHIMISGKVTFQGNDQVYVTFDLGKQKYVSPVDPEGNFSFYVLTGGAENLYVTAWTTGGKNKINSSVIKLN